jgi:D-serine deaminase-like pyridoxal phosphate-dependent protein
MTVRTQAAASLHVLPDEQLATPCLLVFEEAVRHNLKQTAMAAGGISRLMPHVKTHRADWVVRLCLEAGVEAFKCATPTEVEMCLRAGAHNVTWAYPTVNPANIRRLVALAEAYPGAELTAMVDSMTGVAVWQAELAGAPATVRLRVDLDPGLGRTGAAMGDDALALARALAGLGRFAGWHVYDGHVKGTVEERRATVVAIARRVDMLDETLREEGISGDTIAGGSYTFNVWPHDRARYVSPGSWTYSSDQHDLELADLGWCPAAFVLATVISVHEGTATLDAGCKAISPDKPLAERFRWDGRILMMNEEHTVVEATGLRVGDRVLLMPRHACTTAYLYDKAYVKGPGEGWSYRAQLGNAR